MSQKIKSGSPVKCEKLMISYQMELLDLLKKLSKTGNFKVLITLIDGPKKWKDLEKIIDKKTLSQSIKELLKMKLIEPVIIYDSPTGSKAYELTPLGRYIVKKLEELEKISELKKEDPEQLSPNEEPIFREDVSL